MDQVKVILRQLKKHHFWLLVGLAALVGFICWWSGASSLASATSTNRGIVEGSYRSLQEVEGNAHPANQQFAEGVNAKNDELKKQVLAEWQEAFEAQRKTFSWPALVAEQIAPLKPDDPIPDLVRATCRSNEVFVTDLIEKVFVTADYRRPKPVPEGAEAEAAKGRPGDAKVAPPEEAGDPMDGLVVWNTTHRDALEQHYRLMRQPGTPSTLNIRLAQEDIWMLENLAKVIRKTNEGAADVIAVPIKRIDELDVAQWAINDAVRTSPKVYVDKTATDAASSLGGMGGGAQAEGTAEMSPADREKAMDDELLAGRYLGDTGQPLGPADPAPFAEFKLMFVRMKLVIDQRKIPELLVNCADAQIPIEVVRLTMEDPLISSGGKQKCRACRRRPCRGRTARRSGSAPRRRTSARKQRGGR